MDADRRTEPAQPPKNAQDLDVQLDETDRVTGGDGKVQKSDISITKWLDASSPTLPH